MDDLTGMVARAFHPATYLCVVSNPRGKDEQVQKIALSLLDGAYLVERYSATQVFHARMGYEEALDSLTGLLGASHRNLNAWDAEHECSIQISKKGKAFFSQKAAPADAPRPRAAHDRAKKSLLPEGEFIEPLFDMGVLTREGKIVASMNDKYRQINRFIEIVDDALRRDEAGALSSRSMEAWRSSRSISLPRLTTSASIRS